MEDKLKECKQLYKKIDIPRELDSMVNKTIEKTNKKANKRGFRYNKGLSVAAAVFVLCSMFVLVLNTSESLARSVAKVPILGSIAEVLTFVDYEYKNDSIVEEVRIPKVDGLEDEDAEAKINEAIKVKMDEKIAEAEERAAEYKEAYFATGGTEEGFNPIEFTVDYEMKYSDESKLSFVIFQYESLAAAYAENHYYNIDLKTNEALTLKNLLGDNYKEKANSSIEKQIKELKKDPNNMFFDGDAGFTSIKEDQGFYINADGKVTIVFDKYEIAPGAMGRLEFVIE